MSTIGHNSIAGDRLKQLVENIERLIEDRKAVQDDIKVAMSAAKADGYDPKIIRMVIKYRAADKEKREEAQSLLETYLHALGIE
jgi:uncharacterized protein (UPF0335 family)